MSDTVDIGAARVRLIVDAADFQPVIDQGKSAIIGFGNVAQQAYDRTEKGTRRAADALLDYVNSLGRADTTIDRFIRNASRMGVEKPVLDAAITAWAKYSDEVEVAAAAQADSDEARKKAQAGLKDLMSTQAQAETQVRSLANAQAEARLNAISQNTAQQSQRDVNSFVAPNLNLSGQQEELSLLERRKNAMAAFLPQLEEEIKLESEAAQLSARQQAFVQQLENTAATAGKSYYEMLQLRAAELGLGEAAVPLINKIRQQNEAMGAGMISAKQYEFALRGLPAQFTDIVVSLQGGQRPLTVLLQQGGQIKDMFGGVGNAVKLVGQQIAKLATNPWILLAGVVATLGAAAFEAQSRMTELSLATAKGNQVAGSSQGLSQLADQLSKLDHVSIGNADAAVSSLAAAGKLTGDNFNRAAQASARWATITGQGVDEVAGKFNQLATDPMAAVLDGTLRVTAAEYAQLAAFDRVGDKVGEVALAVKLYQDQVNDNSDSVLRNLSEGEKGWIALKASITGAAHAFGEFVTQAAGTAFSHIKAPTLHDLASAGSGSEGFIDLLNQSDQLAGPANGAAVSTTRSGFGGVGTDQAAQASITQTTKLTLDNVQANKENQKTLDEYGTKQQKFTTQLALMNAQLSRSNDQFLKQNGIVKSVTGTLSGPGYDKAVNGLRLKVFGENQGDDPTRPIKEWQKTLQDALKTAQVGLDAFYADGNISSEQYYAVENALNKDNLDIELQSIEKQKAALKGRLNSEAQIAQLNQQRYTAEQTFATQRAKNDRDEVLAVRAKINAYHDYVQQLADANIALSRQGDQAAAGVGTGSRQAALANAKSNAIFAEQQAERSAQDKVDALGAGDHPEAQVQADKDKAAAAAALSTQLDILQGNYDSLATAESSWLNGSVKAWQDWQTQVSNQAAEAGKVFTHVMDGIASSIADAAVSGKLSFKSLIDELLKELVEFGAKQAEAMAVKAGLNSINGGSSASGDFGTNFGGLATNIGALLLSAKGNAFSSGGGLAAYRNSIVTQPTHFAFAKGGVPNVGLMGEKSGSPGEAIMPLTRTAGGELAVKTTGNGNQRPPANITQVFVVPGAQTRQTQDQLAIKSYGAASRATRRS